MPRSAHNRSWPWRSRTGNIVYSDASSVTLTASGGPGQALEQLLRSRERGHRLVQRLQLQSVGTYSLTATDSNAAVDQATGASYSIRPPRRKGGLHLVGVQPTASSSAGPSKITVKEQDAFGNPDPGALTVNLTSSSSNGFFTLSPGAHCRPAVTSVVHPGWTIVGVLLLRGHNGGLADDLCRLSRSCRPGLQAEKINPGNGEQARLHDAALHGVCRHGFPVGRHRGGPIRQPDHDREYRLQ